MPVDYFAGFVKSGVDKKAASYGSGRKKFQATSEKGVRMTSSLTAAGSKRKSPLLERAFLRTGRDSNPRPPP